MDIAIDTWWLVKTRESHSVSQASSRSLDMRVDVDMGILEGEQLSGRPQSVGHGPVSCGNLGNDPRFCASTRSRRTSGREQGRIRSCNACCFPRGERHAGSPSHRASGRRNASRTGPHKGFFPRVRGSSESGGDKQDLVNALVPQTQRTQSGAISSRGAAGRKVAGQLAFARVPRPEGRSRGRCWSWLSNETWKCGSATSALR